MTENDISSGVMARLASLDARLDRYLAANPPWEFRVVTPAEWGQGAPIYPSMTWTRDAVRSGRERLGE